MTSTAPEMLSASDLEMLGDSVDGFLGDRAGRPEGPGGFDLPDPTAWAGLAELGVTGLPFAAEDGGLALGGPELAVVMRALGRRLSTEPYLSSVVLGGGVLRHLAPAAMRAALAPAIVAGTQRAALAYAEPGSRYNIACVETQARADGDGYVIDGAKSAVIDAPDADLLFVTARTAGAGGDSTGIGMFLVPRDAAGLTVTRFSTIDGRVAGTIRLESVRVGSDAVVSVADDVAPALERVLDEARLALAAESVGAIEEVNRQTVDYCRTRIAFGQPLARQQAIQHRLVDMYVAAEYASAIVDAAAAALDGDPERRARTIAAAAAVVAREADMVGKAAVQLHGAIGTTEELPIGRYFKRLLANDRLMGGYDENSARYRNLMRAAPRGNRHV